MAIGIEVYAWLNEKRIRRDTNNLADQLERDAKNMGQRFGDSFDKGITASSAKAGRSLEGVARATDRAEAAQRRYNLALKSGDANRIARATDSYTRALGRQADSQRSAAKTLRSLTNDMDNADHSVKSVTQSLSALGTTAFRTTRGLGAMVAPVVLYSLAEIGRTALTATQSLWLLPAAAAAAGAGMGTLQLATSGFADTIKNIRDPEKFAEAINMLSPAAQQAAMTIKNLLPRFDALKNATQDSFFEGMAEQINRLTTTYLPSIQNLTTSIAASFNGMMTGVADQLMTPETQSALQATFDNIGTFFQNLVPAAGSLAQALTDITSVGSSFLPGLASEISTAAANFASFIREAAQSGKLSQWIQEGIDALKILGQFVVDLGRIIYSVFGPDGQRSISEFKNVLSTTSEVIGLLTLDTRTWSSSWKEELDSMHGPLGSLRDLIMDIPEVFNLLGDSVVDFANLFTNAINKGPIAAINGILTGATKLLNLSPFGEDKPEDFGHIAPLPLLEHGPGVPTNNWRGYDMPQAPESRNLQDRYAPPGGGNQQTWVDPKTGTKMVLVPGLGWVPENDPRAAGVLGSGSPYPGASAVPGAPPKDANGNPLSDKDKHDLFIAGLPESAWKVDPYSGMPGGAPPGTANGMPGADGKQAVGGIHQGYNAFGQPIGPGGNVVDPQKIDDANWNVLSTAHDFEESKKSLLALQADNTATAEAISDAQWAATEKERAWHKAQRELVDAQNGTFKELEKSTSGLTDGMGEIGAALDKDLGISKGLPGLADNLVRFIASMAAAPMMGKLAAIQEADPHKGGFGLIGIAGAQGAFGPDFTGLDTQATTGGPTSQSAYTGTPGPGNFGYPGDAALLANVPSGKYVSEPGVGDLTQGIGDCTSSIEDLVALIDGAPTAGRSMATGNADQWLTEHGFVPGMGGPGDFRVGFNPSHMQATLPGGTPFNWGSKEAAARGGVGGTGADDPAFTSHYYRPGGAGAGAIPGQTGVANFSGGSIPIPLPVTIVGGAGATGGGGGGGGFGGPSVAAAASGAGSGRNFDALAQAEAGGNWGINTGNGYFGGLQFDQPTWDASKLPGMPGRADLATREQQIAAAENAISQGRTPSSLWPQNYGLLGNQAANATTGGSTAAPGLYSPENTNPGLNNPGLPGALPGGGSTLPGAGMPQGMPMPGAGPLAGKQYGGGAPPAPNPGGGGVGMTPGGTLETAMNLGAGALDVLAPGAGQAAATGMKLANRAIQYAGQVAGIGVSGLMETFLPTGASDLAANSWFSRIAAGLAGAAPALPNIAGGKGKEQPPLNPSDVAQQQVNGQAGNKTEINYTHNGAKEDPAIADLTYLQEHSYAAPGPR